MRLRAVMPYESVGAGQAISCVDGVESEARTAGPPHLLLAGTRNRFGEQVKTKGSRCKVCLNEFGRPSTFKCSSQRLTIIVAGLS